MSSQTQHGPSFFSLSSVSVTGNGGFSYASTASLDRFVDRVASRDLPYFGGLSQHDLHRITKVCYSWIPSLLSLGKPLDQMVACEIGCGIGTVSVPLSGLFKQYYGIDIDRERVEFARNNAKALGRENILFYDMDALRFLKQYPEQVEKIDVFILFAVVEHLTIHERKTLLCELARQLQLRGNGILLVAEAPNRLSYFDAHSSQLHFFDLLPEELAVEYYRKSPRTDFVTAIETSSAKLDALRRFGRGVSYHEFDLWLPERWSDRISVDGYSRFLISDNPFSRHEALLSSYFFNHNLPISRCFSRYWIEFICDFSKHMKNQAVTSIPTFVTPELQGDGAFEDPKQWWQTPECRVSGNGSTVNYPLTKYERRSDYCSRRLSLMFNWDHTKGGALVEISFHPRGKCVIPFDFDVLNAVRPKFWHNYGFITIQSEDLDIENVSVTPEGRKSSFGGNYLVM